MKNRLSYSRAAQASAISLQILTVSLAVVVWVVGAAVPAAGEAPQWMHALVNVPIPAHDEKTDAVLLYSEKNVEVVSSDKIRTVVRRAYKILRPDGREHGTVFVPFSSPSEKIKNLRGWCIPAQGKDYEVKDKEGAEIALPKVDGSELITDVKAKMIEIPAPDPGNIIGYEYELEEQPLVLQDEWGFQQVSPVRESRYSLQLPPGWEYKASFLNYPEIKPTQTGNNQWQWTVTDLKGIRPEEDMPPPGGVVGMMIVSFLSPGAREKEFSNWQEMGKWYWNLINVRLDASPEIKQKVSALTASSPTALDKMKGNSCSSIPQTS
jgi:uncharacterized protein DUF3857